MVLRCGDLSHVEVDKNDFIWQLPPKKSVVRWPSSSSIATPISNDRHGKQRPRGILKSSPGKIRTRDYNNEDEDDVRNGSSGPRTPQSSTMAGRDDSCDDYPLAHLEHAGHTPRGNFAQLSLLSFSSSPPHRRGRIQSEPNFTSIRRSNNERNGNTDTENDRHTSQPRQQQTLVTTQAQTEYYKHRRRRRNHHHPTACPVCSSTLAYLYITSPSTEKDSKHPTCHKNNNQSSISISTAEDSSPSATRCTLREINQHANSNNNNSSSSTIEYDKLLHELCVGQSLLPPLCKSCKTHVLFDDENDTECKCDMMDNFEKWYLDNVNVVADDDDRDENDDDDRHGAINDGREKRTAVEEGEVEYSCQDNTADHISLRSSVVDLPRHRSQAKLIVVGGDPPKPPLNPPPIATTAVSPLPTKATTTKTTASTDVADAASTIITPAAKTIVPILELECGDEWNNINSAASAKCADIITPRHSNQVGHKTLLLNDIDGSIKKERASSPPLNHSLLVKSSSSESIQLIHTESEERKILENYSIKKDIASKELVTQLMLGQHELVQSMLCDRCMMPLIKRNDDAQLICATCPGIHRKATWIANQKRQGRSAERTKRHIIKVMNESTDNTVASETSTEDDASSAVVAVADALTIQKETNHLNALEEGLMGSNYSLASIDHVGVDGGYCPYDSTSQNSTNSQQQIDYWVRHSSSQLNDQHLSNPPSFHSHHSHNIKAVRNSTILTYKLPNLGVGDEQQGSSSISPIAPPPMNETVEQLQQSPTTDARISGYHSSSMLVPESRTTWNVTASMCELSKSLQSSSEESSTRCPRFSPSHEMLYRLEDELSDTKGSSEQQPHRSHKLMDHGSTLCPTIFRMGSETREIHCAPTIDGMACHVKTISTIASYDVPDQDQSDQYEGYGTSSDESSTRCPGNLPSSQMIWQHARHDVEIEPDQSDVKYDVRHHSPIDSGVRSYGHQRDASDECAYCSGAVLKEYEKTNCSMPNSSSILSHSDAVYEQNRNRSPFNRNHQSIEDSETSSEVSEIQRPQQNTANALVPGAFGWHACFYGRQCNNIRQTSLSEKSSEVSQIDHSNTKYAAQFTPTSKAGLIDGRVRESQNHYACEKCNHGWHADSARVQDCHECQCNSYHQNNSVTSSEVSEIQHPASDEDLHRHEASRTYKECENQQKASQVDIGVRIARLATSLKNFEHELPLERNSVNAIDETSRSEISKEEVCTSSIHHPIRFWPITDKIGYSSVQIPISPITVGRTDKLTPGGVAENTFFNTNIRHQESPRFQSDSSCMNEHRADPPGYRIEHLDDESRDLPYAKYCSSIDCRPKSTKAKHGIGNVAKSTIIMENLSEDLTRQKLQMNDEGAESLAISSRNNVTPKSRGRPSHAVPTQEADENEMSMPLKRVKSSGESSVDKLIQQIDEIEDDFSSIVASLPGSKDGTSLSLMSSNNSLKSSNAHSLVEITLSNAESFESNASAVTLVTDAVHRMRRIKDYIYQNDSAEESGGSDEGSYNSRMSELIQDLTNAAESLRTMSKWDE